MKRATIVCLAAMAASSAAPVRSQDSDVPLALVGARVYAAPTGLPIFDGTIVAAYGKVVAVGPREKVEIPAGALRLDCAGLVTPSTTRAGSPWSTCGA